MKKFVKVTAIVALVLVIIGAILLTVGAIGGGVRGVKFLAENGKLSFGPEDLDFDLDLFDWGEMDAVYDIDEDSMFSSDFQIFSGGSTKFDTDGSKVHTLVLELGGSDVQIEEGDEDYWIVEAEGIGKFQTYVQDGTLHVLGAKNGINISLSDVVIYMPEDVQLDKLVLSIGAGELEVVDEIVAGSTQVSVGAGSMEIEDLQTEDLEVSVGAGEVVINDGKMGNVVISVGAGSADLKGEITGDIEGSVAMGEMVINVKGSEEEDHNYDLDWAAGNLIVGSREYSGLGNEADIDNGATTTYTLDCAMGELRVSFN